MHMGVGSSLGTWATPKKNDSPILSHQMSTVPQLEEGRQEPFPTYAGMFSQLDPLQVTTATVSLCV